MENHENLNLRKISKIFRNILCSETHFCDLECLKTNSSGRYIGFFSFELPFSGKWTREKHKTRGSLLSVGVARANALHLEKTKSGGSSPPVQPDAVRIWKFPTGTTKLEKYLKFVEDSWNNLDSRKHCSKLKKCFSDFSTPILTPKVQNVGLLPTSEKDIQYYVNVVFHVESIADSLNCHKQAQHIEKYQLSGPLEIRTPVSGFQGKLPRGI